jgi:hypothetical protein
MKIWFTGFWNGWYNDNNFFTQNVLAGENIEITPTNPDLLFYTVFGGKSYLDFNCPRVFWTGENVRPNYAECNLAVSFDYDDHPQNVRVPLYAIHWWESIHVRPILVHPDPESLLLKSKDPAQRPTKFCAFVHGNGGEGINTWGNLQDGVSKRNALFHILNSKKRVDSAGTFLNNTGFTVDYMTKLNFIKDYKFTFAIENSSYPGYVTEKIMDPMMASSVPIYWGSSRVTEEFNPKSFIDANKFSSLQELADYLVYLDNNDDAYDEIYSQPFITGGKMPEAFDLRTTLKSKIMSLVR